MVVGVPPRTPEDDKVTPGGSGSIAVHTNEGAQHAVSVRVKLIPGVSVPSTWNVWMEIVPPLLLVRWDPSMVSESLSRSFWPTASVYSKSTLKKPAAVGVPLTMNVAGLKVRPGGS